MIKNVITLLFEEKEEEEKLLKNNTSKFNIFGCSLSLRILNCKRDLNDTYISLHVKQFIKKY